CEPEEGRPQTRRGSGRRQGASRRRRRRERAAVTKGAHAFLGLEDFKRAEAHIAPHVHRTPVLGSQTLSRLTGFDVRLKAELFQKAGSYKVRGPLNVLAHMAEADKAKGLITSSAGNHAQGVARAARIHGAPAVVVMSKAAKPAKIEATRGYGAEVVL